MIKEIRDWWAEALESGKYKQADQCLFDRSDRTYCCLGVLRSVCSKHGVRLKKDAGDEYLEPEQCEKVTGLTFDQQIELWGMNDSGKDFATIAKHIRETL